MKHVVFTDESVQSGRLSAASEHEHGGKGHDVEALRQVQVGVEVNPDGFDVALGAGQGRGQARLQRSTRRAGLLPEVDKDGTGPAKELFQLLGGNDWQALHLDYPRATGAAAWCGSSAGRPTEAMASNSSAGRPPMELMKIVVTDRAMATMAHTG
jgi:hypothetical protein